MLAPFLLPVTSYAVWALAFWGVGAFALTTVLERYYSVSDTLGFFALSFFAVSWYLLIGSLGLAAHTLMLHCAAGAGATLTGRFPLNPFVSGRALIIAGGVLALAATGFALDQPAFYYPLLLVVVPWVTVAFVLSDRGEARTRLDLLARAATGLGAWAVPVAFVLAGAYALLLHTLTSWANFLAIAGAGYAFLAAHGFAGWLLYQRRADLGVYTVDSPEQQADFEREALEETLESLLVDAHRHCNMGRFSEATALLEGYLAEDHDRLDPLVHERLKTFHHERLLLEHAVLYLNRLVESGRGPRAWTLFRDCVDRDPKFRANHDQTMLKTLESALPEDAALAISLLERFSEDYPGSPSAAEADLLCAWMLAERVGRVAEAQERLAELLRVRPDLRDHPRAQALEHL